MYLNKGYDADNVNGCTTNLMNVITIAHSIVVMLQHSNAHLLQILFLQSTVYIFRALKARLQKVGRKIRNIMV